MRNITLFFLLSSRYTSCKYGGKRQKDNYPEGEERCGDYDGARNTREI
jgi:hypothetical protein